MITNKKDSRQTKQKELIRNLVLKQLDHPTAEQVYVEARKALPKISLGTVYRNLEMLKNNGELIEVKLEEVPTIYDKTTKDHAHFVCKKCKRVEDIEMKIDTSKIKGSQVLTVNSYAVGICSDCVKK